MGQALVEYILQELAQFLQQGEDDCFNRQVTVK